MVESTEIDSKNWRKLIAYPGVAILLLAFGTADAQEDVNEWQYSLMPYLWLPAIDGTLNYDLPPGGGGTPNIVIGPTEFLDLLNFAVLVSGSAKKGRFIVLSDLMYLSMSSTDGRVASVDDTISVPGVPVPIPISASLNVGIKTDLDGLEWTVAGGYSIMDTGTATLDVFAGFRYFGVDVSTRWDLTADITTPAGSVILPAQGSVTKDTDLWDGIVGARGQFRPEFTKAVGAVLRGHRYRLIRADLAGNAWLELCPELG